MSELKDKILKIQRGDTLSADNLNKPIISLAEEVQSQLDDIALDNNKFTTEEKNKLKDIESNAQKNVNSDWNSQEGPSRILNKPVIGSLASKDFGQSPDQFRDNQQNETLFVAKIQNKGLSEEDYTSIAKSKVDFITVTSEVNLDDISSAVNGLVSAVVLKGTWDPIETFPAQTKSGYSYIVSSIGIVDGIDFQKNDRLLSLVDNASTITYKGNWLKLDYTDQVLSVAGKQGNVELSTEDVSGLGTLSELNSGTLGNQVRTNSQAEAKFVHQVPGSTLLSTAQADKLENIQENAQKNVNSDWNSTSGDSEILNKPEMVETLEAKVGTSSAERMWSPAKVHEAARAVSAKIGITAGGTLTESDGGKIAVTGVNTLLAAGLPIGWNIIIASTQNITLTLSGTEKILETNSNSHQIQKGFSVSCTKISSSLWLVHQLRLQLRAGL